MYLWDVFISHASEDKTTLVLPLVAALIKKGLVVWYDDFTLQPGDPLRRSIDEGLLSSRYAIAILSKAYFAKKWPQAELEGLIQRETKDRKVLIPIFHGISPDQIALHSPMLASRVGVNSAQGLDHVVTAILQVASSSSAAQTPGARLLAQPVVVESSFEWPPRASLIGFTSGLLAEQSGEIVLSPKYVETLCSLSKKTIENVTSFFDKDWPDFLMMSAASAMKRGSISEEDFFYLVNQLPAALTSYLFPMAVSAKLISEKDRGGYDYSDGVWEEFKTALGQSAISEKGKKADNVHFIVMQASLAVVRVHLLLFCKKAQNHHHLLSLFFFIILSTGGDLEEIEQTLGPLLVERKAGFAKPRKGNSTRESSRRPRGRN